LIYENKNEAEPSGNQPLATFFTPFYYPTEAHKRWVHAEGVTSCCKSPSCLLCVACCKSECAGNESYHPPIHPHTHIHIHPLIRSVWRNCQCVCGYHLRLLIRRVCKRKQTQPELHGEFWVAFPLNPWDKQSSGVGKQCGKYIHNWSMAEWSKFRTLFDRWAPSGAQKTPLCPNWSAVHRKEFSIYLKIKLKNIN